MNIPHFLAISPTLWTSGQPAPADFLSLAQEGIEVVVNLSEPRSTAYDVDEARAVLDSGMQYVALPVVWTAPKLDDFALFEAVMGACKGRRVLVHCAKNQRVSVFVFLLRVLSGEDPEVARRDLDAIWAPDAIWSAFIGEIARIAEL